MSNTEMINKACKALEDFSKDQAQRNRHSNDQNFFRRKFNEAREYVDKGLGLSSGRFRELLQCFADADPDNRLPLFSVAEHEAMRHAITSDQEYSAEMMAQVITAVRKRIEPMKDVLKLMDKNFDNEAITGVTLNLVLNTALMLTPLSFSTILLVNMVATVAYAAKVCANALEVDYKTLGQKVFNAMEAVTSYFMEPIASMLNQPAPNLAYGL